MSKLTATSEVDAYCTKCKMDLNHRIVAMEGAKIARVECLTCRGQHNYRKPKSGARAPAGKRRGPPPSRPSTPLARARARASSATQLKQRWEQATVGKPPGDFTAYRIDKVLSAGQLVRHKTFGDGVVSELMEDNKVEVLFEIGAKTLAHGRA